MEVGLYEKISIEFTGIEVDEIMCYQEKLGVDTVQKAIMNAVRIAMDDKSEANEIAERYTDLLDRTLQKQVTDVQLNPDGTWSAVCTHTDYDPIWD